MFKFMLEYKASLHIKNRQNLTPLTLAAKLARKEVRAFFENKTKQES
jgi:ankyrin repeat protein